MPIKPENRHRYPADWPAIRASILERAGHRCEHPGCSAGQYEVGLWRVHEGTHQWHRIGHTGRTYREARQNAAEADFTRGEEGMRPTVIVLTIAHLDHQPENCDPENLRALCQRHHLAYDHHHHRANAQATRRAKAGTLELF